MATNEDNDEAEELRFLALKSMVRRSKQNSLDNDADDQDIKLLRAAALKTITHKSNAQNNLLVNKDDKAVKSSIVNEKKRSISGQLSSLRNKKNIKLNENKITDSKNSLNNCNIRKSSEVFKHDHEQEYKHKPILEYDTESQIKLKVENMSESQSQGTVNNNKDELKKIVRNGSMQLSNLDSEKVDETMVLHITFSSSESDDSSSECDIITKEVIRQKMEYNNVIEQLVPVQKTLDVKSVNSTSLEDNKLKMNKCLRKLCILMRNCEAEIEKRNQQVEILLEAYEKYQNHNKSLSSILQRMKTIRDELSMYHSLEMNALNN